MTTRTLSSLLTLFASLVASAATWAQSPESVIEPQIDRRSLHIPRISANDIEIGAFGGILSVQDFGANSSSGFRLGYHVTEDFFIEGTHGRSTVSDQFYYDRGIPIFTTREAELTYYHLAVGINLFPGEVFLGRNWAMTSAVYLVGGLGSVEFVTESYSAFNFGIGIRVLPLDWLSLRFEMRDLMFESDLLGKNELKHNFEMTLGMAAYF